MVHIYIKNVDLLNDKSENTGKLKILLPSHDRLPHRKKENLLPIISDWSLIPLFGKVVNGKIRMNQEIIMLKEIDTFNRFIQTVGVEKTYLLDSLAKRLEEYFQCVKQELGMDELVV